MTVEDRDNSPLEEIFLYRFSLITRVQGHSLEIDHCSIEAI
jgi:hypothetical protein